MYIKNIYINKINIYKKVYKNKYFLKNISYMSTVATVTSKSTA